MAPVSNPIIYSRPAMRELQKWYRRLPQREQLLTLNGQWLIRLQLIYASDILFIMAIYLSKISVAFSFYRLARSKLDKTLAIFLSGAAALFTVISVVVVATQPGAPTPQLHSSELVSTAAVGLMSSALSEYMLRLNRSRDGVFTSPWPAYPKWQA